MQKKLVDAAVWAGADAVKFQSFKACNLVTEDAVKADYQEFLRVKVQEKAKKTQSRNLLKMR